MKFHVFFPGRNTYFREPKCSDVSFSTIVQPNLHHPDFRGGQASLFKQGPAPGSIKNMATFVSQFQKQKFQSLSERLHWLRPLSQLLQPMLMVKHNIQSSSFIRVTALICCHSCRLLVSPAVCSCREVERRGFITGKRTGGIKTTMCTAA